MRDRTCSPGLGDQVACPAGRLCYLRVRISLDHRQHTGKSDLEFELLLIALARVRQIGDEAQPRPQLRYRLDKTGPCRGLTARPVPVFDRLLVETRFGEMV